MLAKHQLWKDSYEKQPRAAAIPISLLNGRESMGTISSSHTPPSTSELIKLIKCLPTPLLQKRLMGMKISLDAVTYLQSASPEQHLEWSCGLESPAGFITKKLLRVSALATNISK